MFVRRFSIPLCCQLQKMFLFVIEHNFYQKQFDWELRIIKKPRKNAASARLSALSELSANKLY